MTRPASPSLIVDAKTEMVASAVAQALGQMRFDSGNDYGLLAPKIRTVHSVDERKEILDGFLESARSAALDPGARDRAKQQPDLILQEIGRDDFDRAAARGFQFEPKSDHDFDASRVGATSNPRTWSWSSERTGAGSFSHPLRYRLRLQRFHVELGWNNALAALAAFSIPVLYFGWSTLPLKEEGEELRFLDSSIWHRYVTVPSKLSKFEEIIFRIEEVVENQRRGLYRTVVALEYLDHVLGVLPNLGSGAFGHRRWVRPLPLQSETWAETQADQLEREWATANGSEGSDPMPLQRRILLIDDYAREPLRRVESTTQPTDLEPEFPDQNKADLVERALRRPFADGIKTADTLAAAEEILTAESDSKKTPRRFDMILLDYLLGFNEEGERDYGISLLQNEPYSLKTLHRRGYRGPLGRFWVFPVSVFPMVIESEMASGAFQLQSPEYMLASGADPACTPNLFRFKFLRFLLAQERFASVPSLELSRRLDPSEDPLPAKGGTSDPKNQNKPPAQTSQKSPPEPENRIEPPEADSQESPPEPQKQEEPSAPDSQKGRPAPEPIGPEDARRLYFHFVERQHQLMALKEDHDAESLLAKEILAKFDHESAERAYFSLAALCRYVGWGTGLDHERALDHLDYLTEQLKKMDKGSGDASMPKGLSLDLADRLEKAVSSIAGPYL